jgi:hypothetical protein
MIRMLATGVSLIKRLLFIAGGGQTKLERSSLECFSYYFLLHVGPGAYQSLELYHV